MATLKEKAEFIGVLSGMAINAEKDNKRKDARAEALDKVLGDGLPATDRDDLRQAMTFKIKSKDGDKEYASMDERGQRKSIETEDARARYQSIDPKDYAKVQAALKKIMEMKQSMLDAKDGDGKALFDDADLMTELFAPLVREGLMPENLVIDEHSETAKLLKNTYESYKKMLEEARQARKEKDAKATIDLHGAGSKLDVLKALGTKAQGLVDAKLGVVADKVGLTPDELTRLSKMAISGVGMVGKGYALGTASGNMALVAGGGSKTKSPTELTLTKDSYGVLSSGISGGVGMAMTAKEHLDAQKIGSKGNRDQALLQAATAAAMTIDQAVCDALMGAYPPSMGSLDGRVAAAIDASALAAAAVVEEPQAATLTGIVSKAMEAGLAGVVQTPEAKEAFAKAAKKLASGYTARVDVGALIKGLKFDVSPVDDAFDPLVAAVGPAAQAAFSDKDFQLALKAAQYELIDASALNNERLTEQLEEAQNDSDEFERQLVLIDEGGEDMARQRSIAALIGQLEKDRLDLEIVLKVGSLLGSFGTSVVTLGVDSSNFSVGKVAGTVATEVGQSLVPAMKAAQLVMEMSVNIIQIARRAEITAKFGADVKKARKAGHALLPAIENFYSSKVAQQTFASIELALQTVQLAGAICASVPEPITMATGKLLGAIGALASAGNDFAEQVYTDAQLDKGWQRTLEALNNPANRRAGLDALRSNGTLAVHAVAWAATEGGDAIAKEILNSCGVDAQTLADSASDQDAVITYLETRLHEDIQFKDRAKIKTDWAPQPLALSFPGWFALVNRACTVATPKMAATATPELNTALKLLDLQPTAAAITKTLAERSEDQLRSWINQARKVETELSSFHPKTPDNQPHTDMQHLRTSLAEQAGDRTAMLEALLVKRKELAPLVSQQPSGRQRANAFST